MGIETSRRCYLAKKKEKRDEDNHNKYICGGSA